MEPQANVLNQKLWGVSLIMAPFLFAVSTFLWENGEYGVRGGTMLVIASIFWVLAFMGLFNLLKDKMPYYAVLGLVIAIYGCISGINFGLIGFYSAVFNISHDTFIGAFSKYPLSFNLLLFWSGPLFPLSLLVLGINLVRSNSVPAWTGILICLGAVAFPLSRIPRIDLLAHVADALLLIPLAYVGWQFLTKKRDVSARNV